MIATRMGRVEKSRLLELIVLGQQLRRVGTDFIDLGPGQPDFPVPDLVIEATVKALREGHTYYSPVLGVSELREAVADRYNRRCGAKYSSANVMVTAGAKGALYHIIGSHLDEGGEVIVPSPYYVSTPEIVKLWGGTPRFLPCRIENGFQLDFDELKALVGPASKGIVLNSPCNPTGAVIPLPLLKEILQLAAERDLFVIMDECYDRYVYPGFEYATIPHVTPDAALPFFIAGSFSKTFSMTGYRLGYAVGPADSITAAGKIQSHSMNGVTTFSQFGGLAALQHEEDIFAPVLDLFTRRRAVLLEEIKGLSDLRWVEPGGAFYLFADAGEWMARTGAKTSEELAARLLKEGGVMVIPGGTLGQEGFIRISFAVPEDQIREAVRRMKAFVEK